MILRVSASIPPDRNQLYDLRQCKIQDRVRLRLQSARDPLSLAKWRAIARPADRAWLSGFLVRMVSASAMLSLPTKILRIKAAVALAGLYAFCVLAPSLAFAFADDPAVPFCLSDDYVSARHHAGAIHVHDAGDVHHHPDGAPHDHGAVHEHAGDPNGSPVDCCGLFPMVGLAGEARIAFGPSNVTSIAFPALTESLRGRGPDRINRPPIV